MKKKLSVLLALVFIMTAVLTLVACGSRYSANERRNVCVSEPKQERALSVCVIGYTVRQTNSKSFVFFGRLR